MRKIGKGLLETINDKDSTYEQLSPDKLTDKLTDIISDIYGNYNNDGRKFVLYTTSIDVIKDFDNAMKEHVEKMFSKFNETTEESDLLYFINKFNKDWNKIVEDGISNPSDSIKTLYNDEEFEWLNIR